MKLGQLEPNRVYIVLHLLFSHLVWQNFGLELVYSIIKIRELEFSEDHEIFDNIYAYNNSEYTS